MQEIWLTIKDCAFDILMFFGYWISEIWCWTQAIFLWAIILAIVLFVFWMLPSESKNNSVFENYIKEIENENRQPVEHHHRQWWESKF